MRLEAEVFTDVETVFVLLHFVEITCGVTVIRDEE